MTCARFIFLLIPICFICISCSDRKDKNSDEAQAAQDVSSPYQLLLLSKGLATDTLKQAFLNLLDDEPDVLSAAIVVNASSTEKKKLKKYKKIKLQFESLGFDSTQVQMFDLLKSEPTELKHFDIIYVLGGNPFLLLDELNKSGAKAEQNRYS
ncbi:MAG: type 1 glutamine amidotransferase-like domain-containing protein [Saprospiraceae bacterium]|nr:type 1 glutamine amidotransferase-like domain-containing protein [Saprospiraceae bacterium]